MTRRYPAYRDSGVEWLGEVPEGWATCSLGLISRSGMGQTILREMLSDTATDETLPVYSASESVDVFGHFANPSIRLAYGDIIVGARGSIGLARFVTEPCTCTQTTIWLRLDNSKVDPHFAYWVLIGGREQLFPFDKTAIPMLTTEQVRCGRIVLPPLPEQTAIAVFLDQETAKIDGLVAEQRRLIDLLQEKRQAVISHAVTKGLNPKAPLKPSGIDWLGDVPEGWQVKKIGVLCERMTYGFTNPMPTTDEGPFLLTAADIENGTIAYSTARHTSEYAFEHLLSDKSRPIAGDVLITKDGTLGRIAVADGGIVCINQSVALVRVLQTEVLPNFIAQLLSGSVHQARMLYEAGGTTIKHIYISRLAQMPVPVPPVDEQSKILDWLKGRVPQFDNLIFEGESALSLLQERRAALISAAVTGKIDVRGAEVVAEVRNGVSNLGWAAVLVGVVIARLGVTPTFGRVKLQKILYLAEAEAGIDEINGSYLRMAAGPYDRELIESVEAVLKTAGAITVAQGTDRNAAVKYRFIGQADAYRDDLKDKLGSRMARFDHLLDSVADLDTTGIEAVATLFAAWNDLLLAGNLAGRDEVIREVLENWHPAKAEKFTAPGLDRWLGWMHRHQIVPQGRGPRTTIGRLFP